MADTDTRRGRPLDPTRDVAIVDATIELFAEVGFDQLTMEAVARRASVGLSTIYRRWNSKSELVAAAIAALLVPDDDAAQDPAPSYTDVLERLFETLGGAERPFYPGVISAMESDPEVAAVVRTHAIEPYRRALRRHVRDVLGDYADDETVRLLADLGPGLLIYRSLIVAEPLTRELVDLVRATFDVTLAAVAAERGLRPGR
ncbi:MAG: TetR/AcrR family transcriptional regulator [Acidimicrobiales bacterium]